MIGSGQRRPAMGGRRTEQVGHGMAVALKVEYSTQATPPPVAPPLTASPQAVLPPTATPRIAQTGSTTISSTKHYTCTLLPSSYVLG